MNEERLLRAQRVARLGSWELDLTTGVMWGSDEAFRIYGLTLAPGNTLPYDLVKQVPLPDDRPRLDQALADLIERGAPYEIRFRIRRIDDGAIRFIHSFAEVTREDAGTPLVITGTVQDVTEHEEAARALQDALRANEERAKLILEQAADAIFIGTPDGTCSTVNEQGCELTGYPRDELVGSNIQILFDSDVLAEAPLRFDLVDEGESVIRERRLTRKDGVKVVVEMRTKRLSDGSFQSIIRDISQRKRLEEQLYLRQRMDSLGTLAGGIAHDFNNILAAIVGYADAFRLSDDAASENRERASAGILQACRRAADLVRGLQMLTRPAPRETVSFDLHTVASEVFRVLDKTTNRIIVKEMRIPADRFHVLGDSSSLYHALMNLGLNAVQAIEEKGPGVGDAVTIEAFDEEVPSGDPRALDPGSYIHVVLRDTGTGMSPEVQSRAFDLLFTTREKGERKGQGLGLAVVYNVVVRHHHGLVEIESTEGEGCAFHLFLPRGEPAPMEGPPIERPIRTGSETILVIEDEQPLVALTREVLENLGYTVLTAADGQEGIELFSLRKDEIDLVLLDRTLPRLAGEKVLQQMLALDPGTKVIVSSGDTSVDLSVVPGARMILHKPYSLMVLFDAIRDVIESGTPG
ncbi:MAG: PAS domain S-box protein [Candidatus Sulfomarinibacteraceae bacterium]